MTGPEPASTSAGDPAERLGRALAGRDLRIAVAESCTGGLVMKRLTDVPGSSGWLEGGVVAYADQVKRALLGVPTAVLASRGAVSEETVRAMAEGVRVRLGTGVGLAVTGIAGPGGGVQGKPVGTVWIAAAVPGATRVQRLHLQGDRSQVRESAARRALEMALAAVEDLGPDPANPEVHDG